MSAFCVFGMTEQKAKELAAKNPPPKEVRTPEQSAAYLAERAAHILENAARRQVSPAFDAPQFCRDWIELAARTTKASRLRVMVRDVKTDKKGNPVLNKRTQLPVMAWRPYDPETYLEIA